MGRLTKYGKTSHENGVCCTHFMSKECKEVGGECSYGCKWEEEAWSKLAHYEDMEEQGRLIEVIRCKDCSHEQYCKQAQYLGTEGYCSKAELKELENER